MAREELMKELERVENAIFIEQMADFMNWANYRKLCEEKIKLQKMIANI